MFVFVFVFVFVCLLVFVFVCEWLCLCSRACFVCCVVAPDGAAVGETSTFAIHVLAGAGKKSRTLSLALGNSGRDLKLGLFWL